MIIAVGKNENNVITWISENRSAATQFTSVFSMKNKTQISNWKK
jgi:hypothetical protein